jgi:hypothetical protein
LTVRLQGCVKGAIAIFILKGTFAKHGIIIQNHTLPPYAVPSMLPLRLILPQGTQRNLHRGSHNLYKSQNIIRRYDLVFIFDTASSRPIILIFYLIKCTDKPIKGENVYFFAFSRQ